GRAPPRRALHAHLLGARLRARHRRAPADSLAAAAGGADRRPLHAGAAVARARSRLRRAVVPTARDDRARLRRPRDRAARHAAAGQLSGGPDTAPTPPTAHLRLASAVERPAASHPHAVPGNPGRPSMMRALSAWW